MGSRIIVLGAGLVGKAIAIDLNNKWDVTAVDLKAESLNFLKKQHNISVVKSDFSQTGSIASLVEDFDLVVGAVPGFMGFEVMKEVIKAGKNMVDISFFPEDPFDLHDLALEKEVCIIPDCGVAPGMSNIIAGFHHYHMKTNEFRCYVGGLPVEREWPFEYKAVFSPIDVIEEYTRPARLVREGKVEVVEALSELEPVDFEEIGSLEAWNSDGLRTLIRTVDIPNMVEKTLRYPGTTEYIRVLRDSGFFSSESVEVDGNLVSPIDVTAQLLFPKWKMKEGDEDVTVMKVVIKGKDGADFKTIVYQLSDHYNKDSKTTSMARTTGYTCTAVASLMLEENLPYKGICPPEYLGKSEDHFNFILNYLGNRGVIYQVEEKIEKLIN